MHRWARADRRDPPTAAGRTVLLRACWAADGSLELVRTTTYRYTTWSPYASPFTATARSSEVVSQAAVRPVGPLAAGQPLVQPVALAVPPEGPGSVKTELVEIGWAVHARLRVDTSRETR
jgi:hypothetical protein